MPRSLRSRLIASHLLVIGLAFLLTVLVAAVPVRRAQIRAEERRLESVAQAIAIQTDVFTRRETGPITRQALDAFLERQSRVTGSRVLLADADGVVLHDPLPDSGLEGRQLPGLAARIELLRERSRSIAEDAPGTRVIPLPVSQPAGRFNGRTAAIATTTGSNDRSDAALYPVVLSTRRQLPVLDTLLRPLVLAALAAALAAVGTSLWLARSIAQPISNLTRAAGTISAGNLDQRVPGEGDDEVGRLVQAFNAMIDRLATTYYSQRALLANIAHELRSPLTSIQGYTQALRDGVVSDAADQAATLGVIQDESERMAELVNQILQLSRLESGQLPLQVRVVSLNDLLERMRRTHAARAEAAGVELSARADASLLIEADAELLLQALGNLVANAVRHTPANGSVAVLATRLTPADAAPLARISVTDTGQGIHAHDLPHIFERFYRGSGSVAAAVDSVGTTEPARRFGLGLAIAREIVTRHGGSIAVASEPGRGTTFTVDLPAATRQHPVDDDAGGTP